MGINYKILKTVHTLASGGKTTRQKRLQKQRLLYANKHYGIVSTDAAEQTMQGLLETAERQWRAGIALALPLALAAAPAVLALDNVPLCAFKHFTGLPCPLCGGTRACGAIAHGDIATAWLLNPGLVCILAVFAVHSTLLMKEAVTGKKHSAPHWLQNAWKLAACAWLVSWLLQLILSAY